MTATRQDRLSERLQALQPEELEVVDDSHRHAGHAGAADGRGHFTVLLVSKRFTGLSTLRRHRLVYEVVGDMMTTDIHALSIQALAPGEARPRRFHLHQTQRLTMRTPRYLFVLAAAGLLAACTKPAGDAAKPAADKAEAAKVTTIATVNGETLSSTLLDTFVQAVMGGNNNQEPPNDEQKKQLTDQLINMALAAQAGEKEGLGKEPQVAARLQLLQMQILAEAASEKFIKAHPVSESELKAEYDAQVGGMPKEYRARHILVEKKETAEEIIKQLNAGADFAKLAEKDSKDSSAKQGGEPGWFTLQTMVKPFSDAVAALEVGKFTETPVQSEFGYHVILLEEVRTPEAPAFDQVKPQVEMFVQRKKLQEYLDGLRKTAKIQM